MALLIAFTVIFPILWIVSLSLDPRNIARPTEFRLIPPGASLDAYRRVLDQPTANPVTFAELALNQLKLASGVAILSVLLGIFAAYSFSRFEYKGRAGLMMSVLTVLILPSIATIAPLFVMLNRINIDIGSLQVQPAQLAVGRRAGADFQPVAICRLESKRLSGHDPPRIGGSGPH